MSEHRIFGPPGCGKTTTLSGLIATACRDYGSERVLVSSFTKAAAKELVMRDLPLNDDQVGTLHALCYRALDRPKLATGSILKDWNEQHPLWSFDTGAESLDDPYGTEGAKDGDKLLQEYNRFRGLQVAFDEMPYTIQAFAQAWQDFKSNTFTMDFTDLIATCLQERVSIPHDAAVLFLDEVQDFSRLELSLTRHWGQSCEKLYLVGDEDQCLYGFKGASPDAFLHPAVPAENIRVLSQSYRVPRAVHAAACQWIEGVSERMPKTYHPRAFEGAVSMLPTLSYEAMEGLGLYLDDWLKAGKTVAVLASCAYMIDPVKKLLRQWGVPFHNPYRRHRGDWNPLAQRDGTVNAAQRVTAFLKLSQGQWWTYEDLWAWAAMVEGKDIFARGAKTDMRRKAESDPTVTVPTDDLDRWFLSEASAIAAEQGDLGWLQANLLQSHARPIQYACTVIERQGAAALAAQPKVIIGTIHSVKGGEADIVVLCPDLSPLGMEEWSRPGESHDAIRRLFYVGMTRAKEELHWTSPSSPRCITGYA